MIYSASGNPAATRFAGDGFKTVYLGFPFEWLPNLEDRAALLGASLRWFCDAAFPWPLFMPAMSDKEKK